MWWSGALCFFSGSNRANQNGCSYWSFPAGYLLDGWRARMTSLTLSVVRHTRENRPQNRHSQPVSTLDTERHCPQLSVTSYMRVIVTSSWWLLTETKDWGQSIDDFLNRHGVDAKMLSIASGETESRSLRECQACDVITVRWRHNDENIDANTIILQPHEWAKIWSYLENQLGIRLRRLKYKYHTDDFDQKKLKIFKN